MEERTADRPAPRALGAGRAAGRGRVEGGQDRHEFGGKGQRLLAATRLRIAFLLMAVGATGPVLLALDLTGLPAGLSLWALAALGMGLNSPTLSVAALALSPTGAHGRAAAGLGLATSMGVAVPTGLGGTVIALQGAATGGPTFAALMAVGGGVAIVGALGAPRISPGC